MHVTNVNMHVTNVNMHVTDVTDVNMHVTNVSMHVTDVNTDVNIQKMDVTYMFEGTTCALHVPD